MSSITQTALPPLRPLRALLFVIVAHSSRLPTLPVHIVGKTSQLVWWGELDAYRCRKFRDWASCTVGMTLK